MLQAEVALLLTSCRLQQPAAYARSDGAHQLKRLPAVGSNEQCTTAGPLRTLDRSSNGGLKHAQRLLSRLANIEVAHVHGYSNLSGAPCGDRLVQQLETGVKDGAEGCVRAEGEEGAGVFFTSVS
jgi:hypothetical protein